MAFDPDAPRLLIEYAAEHDVDLAPYRTELARMKARPDWDPEAPFAWDVLLRLRIGHAASDAVAEAAAIAWEARQASRD